MVVRWAEVTNPVLQRQEQAPAAPLPRASVSPEVEAQDLGLDGVEVDLASVPEGVRAIFVTGQHFAHWGDSHLVSGAVVHVQQAAVREKGADLFRVLDSACQA